MGKLTKWCLFSKWLIITLLGGVLFYGTFVQQLHYSSAYQAKPDSRLAKLQAFLQHTPLASQSATFLKAADENHLDYRLLPAVSCIESSCGRNFRLNAFGFGADTLDFGDNAADIRGVAHKIGTLSYYKTYRATRSIRDFALAYNPGNAESYAIKLHYFIEQL